MSYSEDRKGFEEFCKLNKLVPNYAARWKIWQAALAYVRAEAPQVAPEPKPRRMRLPPNSAYPNFHETHLEDDWCAKAGCRPICKAEAPQVAPEPRKEK